MHGDAWRCMAMRCDVWRCMVMDSGMLSRNFAPYEIESLRKQLRRLYLFDARWPTGRYVLYSYGLYSYGLFSYGLHSYGLYSYGLHSNGRRADTY